MYILDENDKKELEKKLGDKISNPSKAAVGQIMEVAEVDDDGKPTKWNVVDKPDSADALMKPYEFIPVTLDDIEEDDMDKFFYAKVATGPLIGGSGDISSGMQKKYIVEKYEGSCIYCADVKEGDCLIFTNAHELTSAYEYLVVYDVNGKYVMEIRFDKIKNAVGKKYTFEQDGSFKICFRYTTIQSGEFFYIKKTPKNEPYVLYADKAESYVDDADTGEAVMKAIMEGRQIVVRVPNADGGRYMALYSPILMYQLPNYLARHLYLFYLNDGVNAQGLPSYNQLKIAVSRDYNQTPLS